MPQGGPHITADEARAHDTLPFIWMVADYVMERDRRAWWMRHWLLRTRAIQTSQVFEREEPVLLVVNDADDELWQPIGTGDAGPDGKIGHLWHALDEDRTLIDVATSSRARAPCANASAAPGSGSATSRASSRVSLGPARW